MVAAVSTTPKTKILAGGSSVTHQNPKRPPLLPSEADNGPRKPKSKEVTSRYFSSSSSSTSTIVSSGTSSSYSSSSNSNSSSSRPASTKRSQSVERRTPMTPRPSTPRNSGEMSSAAKLLVNSSRNLSSSFQGRSVSLPVSKMKPAPVGNGSSNVRKGTPVRDQVENSKPIDQQRWPGRSRQSNFLTRSVDCTGEKAKLSGSGAVVRALENSMINERSRATLGVRLKHDRENAALELAVDADSASRSAASDIENVSLGSTSSVQECGTVPRPRGVVVPARFWQETNNRLRRAPEPRSPVSKNNVLKATSPQNLTTAKKQFNYSSVLSPQGVSISRGQLSPLRGPVRPSSPSRSVTSSTPSPSRGMPSPNRMRNGVASTLSNNWSNTSSILSFAADARREKVGESRIDDAHLSRLLYNRHLQWRFANARADAAMLAQKVTAEKRLYNAWVSTSKLWHSVKSKRLELQMLRQNLKLYSILKGQIPYLDNWDVSDDSLSSSLTGAIGALEASTLRLPVVCGSKADIHDVKDSLCSALDVMQAMGSSICSLGTKVEWVNSLASELASITTNERDSLDQCKDLLSTLTAIQHSEFAPRPDPALDLTHSLFLEL
ncbi:hypothetical protein LguiA_003989 [Lonicera macranthoides]